MVAAMMMMIVELVEGGDRSGGGGGGRCSSVHQSSININRLDGQFQQTLCDHPLNRPKCILCGDSSPSGLKPDRS